MNYDLNDLAERFVEITGANKAAADQAAKLAIAAYQYSQLVDKGFRQSKSRLSSDPGKRIQRQLERFTRDQPQQNALQVDDPANVFMTQALSRRLDYEVLSQWCSRNELKTKSEKLLLIRRCAPAAQHAIELLRKHGQGARRPIHHASRTLLNNLAYGFQALLGVKPTANKGTRCRQLISECAKAFSIRTKEFLDADMESKTIRKALETRPKHPGIRLARKTNLPN